MIDDKVLKALEFNKIKEKISSFCALDGGKGKALSIFPTSDYFEAKKSMDETTEAYELLYTYGVSGIEFYDDLGDILPRAKKGATLSMGELLKVARFLKSAKILRSSVLEKGKEEFSLFDKASSVFIEPYLENEITSKIISEDSVSDRATDKLFELRRQIKRINEQIKEKLFSYLHGESNKFLQESIITRRGDRYVLPVKSEYRVQINGFVHDQSATGSTLFIEPTAVLDLNNSLKIAQIEEQNEIERILFELSQKVGAISDELEKTKDIIDDFDLLYAKAIYAYKTKAVRPTLNSSGVVDIKNGRHPLIDATSVVPVSLSFGKDYNYLLVSGPNTGGKTVSLKMVGLFALMASSGIYVQAKVGTEIAVFNEVFCDVGDDQSIEESLSTFSSHIKNIIRITEKVDENSLVLIDEIGAGTDPEEGGALAKAIIGHLIRKGSKGIVTTHYSVLKEYAYTEKLIENASMEFDDKTFRPLYRINIGAPGSSNAIEISSALGLDKNITERAFSYLNGDKVSFENVIKEAERARREARETYNEIAKIKYEEDEKLKEIETERKRLISERENLFSKAKAEARRIVNERLEEADAIIDEIKVLFDKEELGSGDLIKARTLRNSLEDKKYSGEEENVGGTGLKELSEKDAKQGVRVYYKPMDIVGEIISYSEKKKECLVSVGSLKVNAKLKDLYYVSDMKPVKNKTTVSLKRTSPQTFIPEVNVIGLNADEALIEVERFMDEALLNNAETVRIVHGKGLKILSGAIHTYLKNNKNVKDFRFGKYGEGEHGVTIVTLR